MAAEPIVIYSSKIDPTGVLELLRKRAPDLKVEGDGGDWRSITVTTRRGLLRKATLSFGHDPAYYSGPGFAEQMRGMQGYFARFPKNALTERVMLLIATFRFALTLHPPPSPELDVDSEDPRLELVFAVAQHLDAALFTPSSLRDSAGKVLLDAAGKSDPAAVLPGIFVDAPPPEKLPKFAGGAAPNPPGPSADRVAKRALALAAVSYRSMLEREPGAPEKLEKSRVEFLSWIDEVGIGEELEPSEWASLRTPIGRLGDEAMQGEWRVEAAAVLAWALGRFELPAYDQQVNVSALGKVLGLSTVEAGQRFLEGAALRPLAEIETLSRQLVAIHWRLREAHLRPKHVNFRETSQSAWFGKMPLEGVRFVDGDLAVGQDAISSAPQGLLQAFDLGIEERHQAVNWLCGAHAVYSRVDTPT